MTRYANLIGNKHAAGAGPNRTSFKPGQEPWNKGRKGWAAPGSERTQFRAARCIGAITSASMRPSKLARFGLELWT